MKILATADIHLDNSTYGRSDRSGLTFRTEDHQSAFFAVVDQAISEIKPDYFTILGDIFESPYPPNNVREAFNHKISELATAGIKVRILSGNHDSHKFHTSVQPLRALGLPGVKVLVEPSVEVVEGQGVFLYFPHCMTVERKEEQLREAFLNFCGTWRLQAEEQGWSGDTPVFLFGHFPVFGALMNDGVENNGGNSVTPADLDLCGANYVMLGDFHAHQVLPCEKCVAAYCGSLERRNFADIEAEKGFVVYDSKTKAKGDLRKFSFVPYTGRKFISILGGEDQIESSVNEADLSNSPIVKISFSGTVEEYRSFEPRKSKIKKQLQAGGAIHVLFAEDICDPEEETKIKEVREQIRQSGKLQKSDIEDIIDTALKVEIGEDENREAYLELAKKIMDEVHKEHHEEDQGGAPCHIRIHGVKMNNFMRYGETKNIVSFDPGAELLLDYPAKRLQWQTDQVRKLAIEKYSDWEEDSEPRVVSIMGMTDGDEQESNGSGKSTVLEAISYGMFERVVREFADKYDLKGFSTTSIISEANGDVKKDAYVELLFSADGALWLLRRGRKGNKSHSPILHLECLADSRDNSVGSHSERLKAGNKETIGKLIKWDYDTFCNSVMFGQSDSGTLLKGGDRARKNVIIDILHMGMLEKYLNEVRERKKVVNAKLAAVDTSYEVLKTNQPDSSVLEANLIKFKEEAESQKRAMDVTRKKIDELLASDESKIRQDLTAKVNEKKAKLVELSSQEATKKQESQTRASQIESQISTVEQEKKREEVELTQAQTSISQCQAIIGSYDEKTQAELLSMIESAKAAKPCREKQRDDLRAEIEANAAYVGAACSEIDAANQEIKTLTELKSQCEPGQTITCSFCKSKVGVEHLDNELKEKDKYLSMLVPKKEELLAQSAALKKSMGEVTVRICNIDEYIKKEVEYIAAKSRLDTAVDSKTSWDERAKSIQVKIDEKTQQVVKLSELLATEQGVLSGIAAGFQAETLLVEKDIQDFEASLNVLSEKLAAIDTQQQTLQEALNSQTAIRDSSLAEAGKQESFIEQAKKTALSIAQFEKAGDDSRVDLAMLKVLEKIFGMNGVPSLIIERYMPLLNSYVAEYLEVISSGKMRAKMVRNERGEFVIEISGASASDPKMLSGGEFVKIKLAFSIGLGMLAFVRSDQVPDFICLDEVFAELDKRAKEQVFICIEKLKSKFRDIIVISHDTSMLDRIPRSIIVNKVDGVCRVEKQLHEV